MRARVAVAVTGRRGTLDPGDVVTDDHAMFAGAPGLWARYVAAGVLEPLDETGAAARPEAAVVAAPENAMRPRPRGRYARRP